MVRGNDIGPADRTAPAPRRVAFDVPQGTQVAVPLDAQVPPAFMALSTQVRRRPPEMPLGVMRQQGRTAPGDPARSAHAETFRIDPTLFEGATDLGYRLASLIVRREAAVAASGAPMVQAGFAELAQMLRMYEHLHILRTPGCGG